MKRPAAATRCSERGGVRGDDPERGGKDKRPRDETNKFTFTSEKKWPTKYEDKTEIGGEVFNVVREFTGIYVDLKNKQVTEYWDETFPDSASSSADGKHQPARRSSFRQQKEK